jgi:hypothetical protein
MFPIILVNYLCCSYPLRLYFKYWIQNIRFLLTKFLINLNLSFGMTSGKTGSLRNLFWVMFIGPKKTRSNRFGFQWFPKIASYACVDGSKQWSGDFNFTIWNFIVNPHVNKWAFFNGYFAFLTCKDCARNYWWTWVICWSHHSRSSKIRMKLSCWVDQINNTCHQSIMPNNYVRLEAFSKESSVTFEWSVVPRWNKVT